MFGRLYPIIDLKPGEHLPVSYAKQILECPEIKLIQLRAKHHSEQEFLIEARALVLLRNTIRSNARVIVNDNTDVCIQAQAEGVHLGQDDENVLLARERLGSGRIIGLSTHSLKEVEQARQDVVNYVALGPIFETGSKENPEPVVGIEMYQQALKMAEVPLVAIGGLTAENAGFAEIAAVISDLRNASDVKQRIKYFESILSEKEKAI